MQDLLLYITLSSFIIYHAYSYSSILPFKQIAYQSCQSQRNMNYQYINLHHRAFDKLRVLNCLEYGTEDDLDRSRTIESNSPLQQIQIRFDCEAVDSDEISEVLFELGVLSVSVEVESMEAEVLNDEKRWADLQKTRAWKTAILRANIPSSFNTDAIFEMLSSLFDSSLLSMTRTDVENKDWVLSVQQNWPPQIIGDLTVRFPWHSNEITRTKHELILQGGAAFGTGDHPTTRLCCKWIQKCINLSDTPISLLDYGTGSGLLGLAALRYGARYVAGTDIDKDALINAQFNCEANGLHMDLFLVNEDNCASAEEKSIAMTTARGTTHSFDGIEKLQLKSFDIIVANILAPILISLAPTLAKSVRKGGKIALSGVVVKQADRVIQEFSEFFDGMSIDEIEEDWVLIAGTRL